MFYSDYNFVTTLLQLKNNLQLHLLDQFERNSQLRNQTPTLNEALQPPDLDLGTAQFINIELKHIYPASSPEQQQDNERKEETSNEKSSNDRNQTKNIPKNFGKAIVNFIIHNPELISKCLGSSEMDCSDFLFQLHNKKKKMHTIIALRELWLEKQFKYGKQMRKLSYHFMRKFSLRYIFNSRISNVSGHIKYRKRIIEVLANPEEFTSVKTY